jgi:hypothetical protein
VRFKRVRPNYVLPHTIAPVRLWLADVRVWARGVVIHFRPGGLPTYFQTRWAVMSISIQPWHGPLKMSVCMTPASVPLAWGV